MIPTAALLRLLDHLVGPLRDVNPESARSMIQERADDYGLDMQDISTLYRIAAGESYEGRPTIGEVLDAAVPDSPHSRACGIIPHAHGVVCSSDCPTCWGMMLA